MELESQLAEGALQFLRRSGAGNPEDLVVVALLGLQTVLLGSKSRQARASRLVLT
jgi:hypothetical protein